MRVRPDLLARQKLPDVLVTKDIWKERFKDIRDFERHLARNGIAVLKFFLHVSPEEQRRRLLARLDDPAKRWKFARLVVAGAMIEALEGLNLEYPKIEGAALEELQRVRKTLLSEERG